MIQVNVESQQSRATWCALEQLRATGRRAAVPTYIYVSSLHAARPPHASYMQKYQWNLEPHFLCHCLMPTQ